MTFVITSLCIGTKDTSCSSVCPVDCISSTADSEQYYIDPRSCIDCGACMDACPVAAIYPEEAVPTDLREAIVINANYYSAS